MRSRFILLFWLLPMMAIAQSPFEQKIKNMPVVYLDNGVTLTFDEPEIITSKPTKVILYALPNGNTTAQTYGKKLAKGDDWHFDIQHIGAQTSFIRNTDGKTNYIVVYVENSLKSWPQWRRQNKNSDSLIHTIVDTIYRKYQNLKPTISLTGHSGGGSFIFGYLNAQATQLPKYIERIGFLDATYAYETEKHQLKLEEWLKQKDKYLQVIAYNDSVVIYNGKPLVSATGGTWYQSKLMAKDLKPLKYQETNEQLIWQNKSNTTSIILINNPEGKILHTVMVERNGFVHLLFNGTKFASKNYRFWHKRAYDSYILE